MLQVIDRLYDDVVKASAKRAQAKIDFERKFAAHDPNGKEAYLKRRVFEYKTEIASSWLGRLWANSDFEDVERVNIVHATYEYFKPTAAYYKSTELLWKSISELMGEFIEAYAVVKVLEKDAANGKSQLSPAGRFLEQRKRLEEIGFFGLELVMARSSKTEELLKMILFPDDGLLWRVESTTPKEDSSEKKAAYQIAFLNHLKAMELIYSRHANKELAYTFLTDLLGSSRNAIVRNCRGLKTKKGDRFVSYKLEDVVRRDYNDL